MIWRRRFVLLIYNLLLPFGLLFALPFSLLKMRKRGGYGKNFWERFGIYSRETRAWFAAGARPLWMHAVSVGEVNVARKIIGEILKLAPHRRIVLSTTTSTGHAVALENLPDQVRVTYNPVDLLGANGRALRAMKPDQLVLVEAEVWPNLAAAAKRRGLPLYLANARLSPRSERRYRAWRWWVEPVFSLLDKVFVQDGADVARWESLGVTASKIVATGSVKFDQIAEAKQSRATEFAQILANLWGDPPPLIVLGASTHAGEEKMLGEVLLKLREEFPNMKCILVPRHVERSAEVATELASLGLKVALRNSLTDADRGADVLLINTTGELRDWQQLPHVVVIGKSFHGRGGQNPVEAVAAGKPVITGPNMENFSGIMQLLRGRGICQLADSTGLAVAIAERLRHPEPYLVEAVAGRAALHQHAGAAARTAREILQATPAA